MNLLWFCITLVLSISWVSSDQNIDTSHIKVFPAANQSIAGVFQVSYLNDRNQLQYAFNASEARLLCSSLGVDIASKAQVIEALTRGLETCRFGWIDEHFAVIPRRTALNNCGRNKTGLVPWRADVTQKFDVFCFNESDAAIQLKDTTTDSSRGNWGQTESANSTQKMHSTSSSTLHPSSSSPYDTMDSEAKPARFVGSSKGSPGATAVLITSTCSVLLLAVIVLAYIKMRRSRILSSDEKQQQEYIQTEEWTCVKNVRQTKTGSQEDERIEVDDAGS